MSRLQNVCCVCCNQSVHVSAVSQVGRVTAHTKHLACVEIKSDVYCLQATVQPLRGAFPHCLEQHSFALFFSSWNSFRCNHLCKKSAPIRWINRQRKWQRDHNKWPWMFVPLSECRSSCYQIIALIQITVPVKSLIHSWCTMPNHSSCYILHSLN